MSLTASKSSRLTRSRSRRMRSAWLRNSVSTSRRTPCAAPAASFISRATSSKNRFVVWTMAASPGVPLDMPADNGDGAARSQEARRDESRRPAVRESLLMLVVMLAVLPVLPFPAINPILISIGPFAVRWYALAYIVGIILGGRTGYVLFYNLPHFIEHPGQIFELWNGGMSFHGGVAGCIVAIVAFALKRGIPMLSLGDVVAAVCPIGLFLGRIANFINGELWGRPTDVPWAMIFPNGGPIPRHPSQLYEATLEGVVLFVVLGLMVRFGALKRPGVVTGSFALGYGVARVICELFREPDVQLGFLWGGLTMGMLLCIPLMLGGIAILTYALSYEPKPKDG